MMKRRMTKVGSSWPRLLWQVRCWALLWGSHLAAVRRPDADVAAVVGEERLVASEQGEGAALLSRAVQPDLLPRLPRGGSEDLLWGAKCQWKPCSGTPRRGGGVEVP